MTLDMIQSDWLYLWEAAGCGGATRWSQVGIIRIKAPSRLSPTDYEADDRVTDAEMENTHTLQPVSNS